MGYLNVRKQAEGVEDRMELRLDAASATDRVRRAWIDFLIRWPSAIRIMLYKLQMRAVALVVKVLRKRFVTRGLLSTFLGNLGVLSLCAVIPFGLANTLVPTARGYARPTFRKWIWSCLGVSNVYFFNRIRRAVCGENGSRRGWPTEILRRQAAR